MRLRDIGNVRGRYVKNQVLRDFLLSQSEYVCGMFGGLTFKQCRPKLFELHVILNEDGQPIKLATTEQVAEYAKDRDVVELANNYVEEVREELFTEILK